MPTSPLPEQTKAVPEPTLADKIMAKLRELKSKAVSGVKKLPPMLDTLKQKATDAWDRVKDKLAEEDEDYLQGFTEKCAAAGIDPLKLLKLSQANENPQEQDALESDEDPNRRDNATMGFNVKNYTNQLPRKSTGKLPFRSETRKAGRIGG